VRPSVPSIVEGHAVFIRHREARKPIYCIEIATWQAE
jgi:hypothetical protein